MSTYITVKYNCNYTSSDWHIKAVHTNLNDSLLGVFRLLLDELSTDYMITFYKDREAEFAHCVGLSDFYIHHWEKNQKVKTYTIGFQDVPYRHRLDVYLKENHDKIDQLLNDWHQAIKRKEIPADLQQYIFESKYN